MPLIIAALASLFTSTALRGILTRILVALGVSMVTYTGISASASAVVSSMQTNLAALPAAVLSLLALAHVGQAFNVVISAQAAALAIRGISAGAGYAKVRWGGNGGSVFENRI